MRKTIVLSTALILLQIRLLAYVLLQEHTWGGPDRDGALGVAFTPGDNSVYVTGGTRSVDPGGEDAFLLKYNTAGDLLWQRTYGRPSDQSVTLAETGVDVAVAPDNTGVLIAGNFGDGNIFLAKFSHEGALLWDRTWGGNNEGASALAIAPNGTIYVAGSTRSFDAGQGDAFLLSFTADGTLNWQRTWGGEFFDAARDVAIAPDAGVYISGETIFSANSAFLVKFTADGSVLWEREWGLVEKGGFPEDNLTQGNGVAGAPGGRW